MSVGGALFGNCAALTGVFKFAALYLITSFRVLCCYPELVIVLILLIAEVQVLVYKA